MRLSIPVDPDADEASRWAEDELAKPEYAEQGPSLLDRFYAWLEELLSFTDGVTAGMPPMAVLIGIVLAAGVVALIVWLVMGPLQRSRRSAAGAALDPDDARSANQMREAAQQAAARADWDTAVMEMFRAIARGAHERGIIDLSEGMTAHEAAEAIARATVDGAVAVTVGADFDTVRYSTGGLTEAAWLRAREADSHLARAARVTAVGA